MQASLSRNLKEEVKNTQFTGSNQEHLVHWLQRTRLSMPMIPDIVVRSTRAARTNFSICY